MIQNLDSYGVDIILIVSELEGAVVATMGQESKIRRILGKSSRQKTKYRFCKEETHFLPTPQCSCKIFVIISTSTQQIHASSKIFEKFDTSVPLTFLGKKLMSGNVFLVPQYFKPQWEKLLA